MHGANMKTVVLMLCATFPSIVENHKVADPVFSCCSQSELNISFIKYLEELILRGVTFGDLLESYTELQGVQLVTKRDEQGE